MFTAENELIKIKEDESIQEMHTRFTSIINELYFLGEIIPTNKIVRKILTVLPGSWKSKVNAITEAKDLQKQTIDELIGNLKTYEIKRKKDLERKEPKKLPTMTQEVHKNRATGNVVKHALAVWGDSSSESKGENDQGETSMMVVDNKSSEYESIFALEAKYDDDNDVDKNLINEKNALTREISDVEQESDDMIIFIVDLKEHVNEAGVRGVSQMLYMNSGCSKHMTGIMDVFLSLKAFQGESVSFGNDKKWYILGVDKIYKILSHTIENVYYVNVLKYRVLSVSQICAHVTRTCKFFIAEQTGYEGHGSWTAKDQVPGSQDV
ncbi:uncharacterized protein [Nicotiana tomentosiformis]|uniref:uncharacterized protein n=1 Tax=Nicotiana tomentosiformis TaxID=4098 RepID=UPI00388C99A4